MRILLLVLNLTGKGTYWRALYLGRELAERGHAVTLVSTAPQHRLRLHVRAVDGLTHVEAPDLWNGALRSGWDPWNALRRVGWLAGRRFDVVHAFETRPTVLFPTLYEKKLRRTPVVLDWADWFGRGGSVEERPNPLLRALLRPVETFFEERFRAIADRTTVISTPLLERAIQLGVDPATVRVLPNGCNTRRFFPVDRDAARRQVGIDHDGPLIGYCGTIFARDAELMAAAFDRLHALRPDARLLIAGYFPADLRARVAAPHAVIQTGYVADHLLNDYLGACDLCWLPFCDSNANRGRWPMKLNDYMAVGRPTVATAVGDVATLLRREPIGLLADPDPQALATQTLRLLDDPELRRAQGRHARRLALTRFSWAALAAEVEALYQEIV